MRRHRDGIPEVERVVALVVVGDAGMGVYGFGGGVELRRRYRSRDEGGLVAQDAGVEDRTDLAYNPPPFQRVYAPYHLVPGQTQISSHHLERLPRKRKLPLDAVEQVLIDGIHHPGARSCAYQGSRALLDAFLDTFYCFFEHDSRGDKNWLVILLLPVSKGRATLALPAPSGTRRRPPVCPSRRRVSRGRGLRRADEG